VWPAGWQVLELSPARVAEQRRVQVVCPGFSGRLNCVVSCCELLV
jgi:hypothetical protein